MSDGEDSSSIVPLPIVLKLLNKYGIKVYSVIIDKSASDIMHVIAKSSQTVPYYASNKKSLHQVYKDIDTLEKSKLHSMPVLLPQPLYMYFLTIATLLSFVRLYRRKNIEGF